MSAKVHIRFLVLSSVLQTVLGGYWTIWYDVSKPDAEGENESWREIKDHGYTVCGDKLPDKARCRMKSYSSRTIFFTNEDFMRAANTLEEPCTRYGVVCRNQDQSLSQPFCQDYTVSFYCEDKHDKIEDPNEEPKGQDSGMIAMAAGLCVLVPLMCVAIFQCVNHHKMRRIIRNRQRNPINVESNQTTNATPRDPSLAEAPPSYDTILSNNDSRNIVESTEPLIETEQTRTNNNNTNNSGSTNHAFESGEQQIFQISTGNLYNQQIINQNIQSSLTGTQSRFPGMHLSFNEVLVQPQYDISNPPPTYGDAMVSVGELPPKYTDIVSIKE